MSSNPQQELLSATTAQTYSIHSDTSNECGTCIDPETPIRSENPVVSDSPMHSETFSSQFEEQPKISETNLTHNAPNHLASAGVGSSQTDPTSNVFANSELSTASAKSIAPAKHTQLENDAIELEACNDELLDMVEKTCNTSGSKTFNDDESKLASNGLDEVCNNSKKSNANEKPSVSSSLFGVGITMLSAMRQSVAPKLFTKADNRDKKLCGNSADVTTTTNGAQSSNSENLLNKLGNKGDSQSNGNLSSSSERTVDRPAVESANSRLQGTIENGKKCPKCICHRPVSHVVCLECRNYFQGHALRACPEHPRRINLMDIAVCPNAKCRGTHLEERSSTPSPEEKSLEEPAEEEEASGDKIKSD